MVTLGHIMGSQGWDVWGSGEVGDGYFLRVKPSPEVGDAVCPAPDCRAQLEWMGKGGLRGRRRWLESKNSLGNTWMALGVYIVQGGAMSQWR